jgi:hypothetical protein
MLEGEGEDNEKMWEENEEMKTIDMGYKIKERCSENHHFAKLCPSLLMFERVYFNAKPALRIEENAQI